MGRVQIKLNSLGLRSELFRPCTHGKASVGNRASAELPSDILSLFAKQSNAMKRDREGPVWL